MNKIQNVKVPKLLIHSPSDEVVPYRLGKKLYESAPKPKEFYKVLNAGHNDTYMVGGEKYISTIKNFIHSVQK